MKTMLRAGMLSVLITCAYSVQAAENPDPAAKVAPQSVVNPKNQAAAKVDLNKADVKALAHSVKGIGEKRAEAIIKYRQTHGAFKSIADLANVPGLGNNFVKKNYAELEQIFRIN